MRAVALDLIEGREHYERVIAAVLAAKVSVWIATANVKELMVEDHRARPGRRRSLKQARLRLRARAPRRSRRARRRAAPAPRRAAVGAVSRASSRSTRGWSRGGLALRRCPRVHLKTVIVDGELLYLGSANWTGAGLGAKGAGRRNFELGIVTDDGPLLDQVQALYERIWSRRRVRGLPAAGGVPRPAGRAGRQEACEIAAFQTRVTGARPSCTM